MRYRIEGPAAIPRSALAAIREELEEAPALYTIDVVELADYVYSRLAERARRFRAVLAAAATEPG